MDPKRQADTEMHKHLSELLDRKQTLLYWRFAERDDAAVAQALYSGAGIDTVYGLDEVGLLDSFFAFLDETGIKTHYTRCTFPWQALTITGARHLLVPAIMFVLLYGTRILFGIESSNALLALLFSNMAAMQLLGFNTCTCSAQQVRCRCAEQVADGLSQRGKKGRTSASEYTLGESTAYVMDPQTLAGTVCKISAQALEELFNGTIRALAAFGVFMAEVTLAPALQVQVWWLSTARRW